MIMADEAKNNANARHDKAITVVFEYEIIFLDV